MTWLLLIDGVYLAFAMYATGATQSPIRFLVYLHLVAVSLLASYRTGLKIALWHSLLLFVVLYAQAASLVPPVDVIPGARDRVRPDAGPQRHLVLAVRDRDVGLLGAERARAAPAPRRPRRRWSTSAPGSTTSPTRSSRRGSCSTGSSTRFGFERGVVLGAVRRPRRRPRDPRASTEAPTTRHGADWTRPSRAWERRDIAAGQATRPGARPVPRRAHAGRAATLLVAPMIADGRPVGAIVVEHRSRPAPASSAGSPRCSASSPRSPPSTCATPSCCGTSRTWPSATR